MKAFTSVLLGLCLLAGGAQAKPAKQRSSGLHASPVSVWRQHVAAGESPGRLGGQAVRR